MKTSKISSFVLVAQLLLGIVTARAEDIDIYGQIPTTGANPNVMIILDNASAWDAAATFTCPTSGVVLANNAGKDVGFEQCSLYEAIKAIGNTQSLLGRLNMGLMMFGSNQNGGGTGGTIMYPSTIPASLPTMNSAGITAFQNYIKTIDRQADNANNSQVGGGMQESWAFFTGNTGMSGRSYAGQMQALCQKNFIIYIANALNNGKPQDSGQFAQNALQSAGASTAQMQQISTSNLGAYTKYDSQYGDEWARFLYQTDFGPGGLSDKANIITYTIAVTDGTNPDYVQSTKSMAVQGGGKSFVVTVGDVSGLVQALLQIFNEIQAVNSVFASASLPVSVNTQGTYLNQVYIGMFRPDGSANPRWNGNLKQYQFGVDLTVPASPQLFLADSTGAHAISSAGTGFIVPTAVSFWTGKNTSALPDNIGPTGGFWISNPTGAGGGFDSPDGELVEKGGAGQQLRLANLQDNYVANPSSPRNLYTCTGSCAGGSDLSTTPFATSNSSLTAAALGISNPVYSQGVTNISRVSATGIVTVTLSGTPNPTITDPNTVTITGSLGGQFNYDLNGKSPSASGTTVTYTLPAELPPTSLASPSSWTVTGAAAGSSNVSSLTRTSNAGLITVTATLADLTFGGSTTAAIGESVNVANSTGYNATGTITGVNTGASTITYTMSETPSVYGGGGSISVGSTTCKTTGNKSTHNCNAFGASNTNGPGVAQASLPGLIRGKSCAGCIANSGNILMVNVSGGSNDFNAVVPATGVKAYIQSGATPSAYVNTTTGWTIVGIGAACSVTETHTDGTVRIYTGTATSGTTYFTFCLDLGASFGIAPAVTGNGATSSPQTTAARQGSYTRTISTLSRGASACTGMGSGATANNATVTVTTTANHGFSVNEVVQVSTATPGTNENSYIGPATVLTVPSLTQFTYAIGTTPACKDSTAGMSISYQSSVGGISPTDLIRWVRGYDNIGDERSPGYGITIRPSIHGDVLHSRPAIVNYGGGKIVAFYGGNDGVFRAINANQTGNIGNTKPGGELWGFIPTDFFSRLARQYSNSPSILLSTTPGGIIPTPLPKDYFFDGNIGIYQNADNSKVYLYLTARRGGRLIYALDVTNAENPKFLWKKSSADTGYGELGYTWSEPKVATIRGNSNPVLMFGAGYDPSDDMEPPGAFTMGRGIFVLDAVDGSILWKAGPGGGSNSCTGASGATACQLQSMTYPIPADLALVDRNFDGVVDRAYAADTGGNIWRVDFETSGGNAPANWSATRFAALGGASGDTTKRKLLFPPDVVATRDFDLVLAITGDREHPLKQQAATYGIINRFYMLKDPYNGIGSNLPNLPSSWTAIADTSSSTGSSAPPSSASLFNCAGCMANPPTATYDLSGNGFYFALSTNPGEKGVNKPNSIGGFTYFGTNQPVDPVAGTCATGLGIARGYRVNAFTGATRSTVFDGGGLPPSPVVGLVSVTFPGATNPTTVPFLIGGGIPDGTSADSRSAFGGQIPPILLSGKRTRKFWNTERDK